MNSEDIKNYDRTYMGLCGMQKSVKQTWCAFLRDNLMIEKLTENQECTKLSSEQREATLKNVKKHSGLFNTFLFTT